MSDGPIIDRIRVPEQFRTVHEVGAHLRKSGQPYEAVWGTNPKGERVIVAWENTATKELVEILR